MKIAVRIEGHTPLLCNRFTDKAAQSATGGTRMVAVGDKGLPREQAEEKLYLSETTGEPMIPQPNLFRAIIDAGKFHKAGKSKVTTAKSSLIPAFVSVDGIELPLIAPNGWEVDTRAVRIPSTGGRILCYRPRFDCWALEFTIDLDTTGFSVKVLRDIVDDAGKRIGLGDFRPDCKGPFGKFVVTKWEIED
jgi:hypothetical protein